MNSAADTFAASLVAADTLGLRVTQEGSPLCSCTLGKFGGIELGDPFCRATDMH